MKQKLVTKPSLKNTKSFVRELRNLSEGEKIKNINYAENRNKTMSDAGGKRKIEYMKNYCFKRKKLLHCLLNRIDKFQNVCTSK